MRETTGIFRLALGMALLAALGASGLRAAGRALRLSPGDTTLVQGALVRVLVEGGTGSDSVIGRFAGRALPLIPCGPGRCYALIGIDMETPPGDYPLQVRAISDGLPGVTLTSTITVRAAGFPVQRLTLPPEKVFPDTAAQRRIEEETARRDRKWSQWSDRPFWEGSFIAPCPGKLDRFGHRRIINGAPRSPHTGVDLTVDTGTPVLSPAPGRVLLTGDFFFSGGSIYLDHGLGLISMFFHLSRIDVAEGQLVEQGQVLGAVGATGRVTGPHLHWGVRWRDSRIDPAALLKLRLD